MKKICNDGKHYWLQNIRSTKQVNDINDEKSGPKIDPCVTPHIISR